MICAVALLFLLVAASSHGNLAYGTDPLEKAFVQDRCTAIAVGCAATADGSTMTTHTSDCADCDWRLNKVPARDWPPDAQRPLYQIKMSYPRQVREDRGATWHPDNLENLSQRSEWEKMRGEIVGYIPQVPHTFAIIEGMYGIMNEHQVAMGESTCAAKSVVFLNIFIVRRVVLTQ